MKDKFDWEPFRPIIAKVFYDNKETGGRPHIEEVIIIKTMLLQSWYGLSDPELEFMIHDRLSFRNFLDFPKNIPDFSTIWKIRERLKNTDMETEIWTEVQRQLDAKGYTIKNGSIQDAAFIESDLGKKRHYKEKKAKKKDECIEYTKKQISHIDKDATFSVKNNQIHHRYKTHIKIDKDRHFIRKYKITTASVHDSNIDLATTDDVVYRDRGYTGKETIAKGNATMKRGNLTVREKRRNYKISKKEHLEKDRSL
ncbi:MAG: IS5 family transposase [DPANN group archaeon]|nr:IS5 family transposase [DPANN group archaeon]